MEPTRVGSFDDEMYRRFTQDEFDDSVRKMRVWMNIENEIAEQRIADSHDITKSNFGFNTCSYN